MKTNLEVHPIQGKILRYLLFRTSARFSELNADKEPTDLFTFHLKALVEQNIVQKIANGKYELTVKGKEFANRFDTDTVIIERQAKITLAVVPVKKVGNKIYFLLHQRLKQPYFGYWGYVTGKVKWGESVLSASSRELFEETNLQTKSQSLMGIFHMTNHSPEGDILEDKYFYVIRVNTFKGTLTVNGKEGTNQWFTIEEIKKLPKTFVDLFDFLNILNGKTLQFLEKNTLAEGY